MKKSPSTARSLGSFCTAGVGLVNIVSALYPAIPSRMELLQDFLPLHVIRSSQTATVFVGFLLVLLADGLRRRRKRAMQITVALLLASTVLNLAKGLDFEEASAAAILAMGLVMTRKSYDIPSRLAVPRRLAERLLSFGLLYYCYVLAGFFVLRRAIFPAPTFAGATLEPIRALVGAPSYTYLTAQGHWFDRSMTCLACVVALSAVALILRPLIPHRTATPAEISRARSLVRRYGEDSLSYFALQDGRSYFFHPSGEAFLSYRLWGTVALVGADPVGPHHLIPDLVHSFLEFAQTSGIEPCFLGVSGRHLSVLADAGLHTLKIGEEAIIELPAFDRSALKRKVRRAERHVADQGIRTVTYRRNETPPPVLSQMEEISREWVKGKGGRERGFSMTLGRLPGPDDTDCEITVAMQGDTVWGYICVAPVYEGNGWSLDAMRRRPEGVNGLMEFLVIHAAERYRDQGFEVLSLNFATLSNNEDDIASRALEGTRRFLFENLSSVYQLKSLHQFNSKFHPLWRSRYLAYGDILKFPKLAIAIVQSEDPLQFPSPVSIFRR